MRRKARIPAIAFAVLLAWATVATAAERDKSEASGGHSLGGAIASFASGGGEGLSHSYGAMHATVNVSSLSASDKEQLHEAIGHAADMESARQQAELLRQQKAQESDPEKQAALQGRIDALQTDYDTARTEGQANLDSSESVATQVGDSISNLISQVNAMINNSVWHGGG